MSDSTKNIDMVERYFDNDMTEEEKVMFHETLKTDRELRHIFDRERLLINTVRFGAAKNHLDFFKELEKSLPEVDINKKTTSSWIYYAAAASVIILILAGVYIFQGNGLTPQELYAEHFAPYPNVFEPTVRGSESATKRAIAFQKYEEGEYQQAANLFSELLIEQRQPEILLLLGNANLSLGKTDEATSNFSEVIKTSTTLRATAAWYLSLTHLKDGETDSAIEILKSLAEDNNAYTQRAEELLTRLKQ